MNRILQSFSIVAIAVAPLGAQSDRPFCWLKTQPAPACGSFLVMEAAVEFPFAHTVSQIVPMFSTQPQPVDDYDTRFTLTVGGMVNRGPTRAIGGTLGFVVGSSTAELPARAEFRMRNWRGKTAVDLSAGVARKGVESEDGNGLLTAYGGTAALGVERGFIGADLRVDLLRAEGRTVAGGFVGAKATAAGAPIAAGLATIALFILIASVGPS